MQPRCCLAALVFLLAGCGSKLEGGETETCTDVFYADTDGDGYGDPASSATACDAQPSRVPDATDCDDATAAVFPGAVESCNEVDDDCDGVIDEDDAVDATVWYGDADEDGYGGTRFTVTACDAPSGYVAGSDDCDDLDPSVHPGAVETCDERDEDCDGGVDEGVAATWYRDADGDLWGTSDDAAVSCEAPPGYVDKDGDCDDGSEAVAPDLAEECFDGMDNDCDTTTDCDDADCDDNCDNNEDFDDTAVGDWPDGWDIVWDDAGQTIDAGIASDSTGNYLYLQSPDSPYDRFAAKKEDVEAEDLEVLFLTSSAYFNFAIRAQGDSATGHNAYHYNSWNGYHALVQEIGSFDSFGGWTSLTSLTSCSTCTSDADSWVRLRVEGSTLSVRRWLDGDSEPSTWDLEVTDTGISGPGWFGPVTYTNFLDQVRRVAWAIDGDTAGF